MEKVIPLMRCVKRLRACEVASLSFIGALISLSLLPALLFVPLAGAQGPISLYYFYAEDCPHCREITTLLEELEVKYPELEVHKLEISSNTTNSELFNAFIHP